LVIEPQQNIRLHFCSGLRLSCRISVFEAGTIQFVSAGTRAPAI
jgi:hypothetical protein